MRNIVIIRKLFYFAGIWQEQSDLAHVNQSFEGIIKVTEIIYLIVLFVD